MSTIPMPDPMVEVDKQIVSSELQYTYLAPSGGLEHGTYLITTTQAEAYADSKVREALEQAAKICENTPNPDATMSEPAYAFFHADAIRSLIPKEKE